ncbi:MAG: sialate O-acetylesterase [Bacteroidota bacterium]|nr:sialate O-acetylesterase [Bacteroidota bacterium]
MKKRYGHIICLILILIVVQCAKASANIRLPQLIADGMVLQRDIKLKVWGWGRPGEKVSIKFNGIKVITHTGTDGNWSVTLPEMHAGGPYQMEVKGDNLIILRDVLIGDVWFCSGQSNMTIKMERVKEKYPDEIAGANFPAIRYFFVPTLADVQKVHNDLPPGKWVRVTSEHILDIGAVSYFFAKKLYTKYHIPIGIINSSVGGTPIQAWIGEEGINGIDSYDKRLKQLHDSIFMAHQLHPAGSRNAVKQPVNLEDKGMTREIKWYDPAFEPKNWHRFWLPGYWADQGVRDLNGIVWFRREITVPAEMAGKPAKLFLGRIINADETYVNGKLVGNTTYEFPPRRYEVPSGLLKEGKNLITVRITNTAGKGGFVPDKRYELTNGEIKIDLRGDWSYQVGSVYPPFNLRQGTAGSPPFSSQNEPTGLYNTMVAPALNFPVKGIIWYQGESNTGTRNYHQLLDSLISNWRAGWKREDLPFLIVQLPNFGDVQYSPSESSWAGIREAQLQVLSLPHTGLAVTIDAGEWNDIHPLDKKDVGDRLAIAAQKVAYGDSNIIASGPIFHSARIDGDHIVLTFSDIGSGLATKQDEPPACFEIAGPDKHFVRAVARIEGDKVSVSSPEVQRPAYVRYAWADNPEGANLINREGLPASPFRTDQP